MSYQGRSGVVDAVDLTPGMVDIRFEDSRIVERRSAGDLQHAARENTGRPRLRSRQRSRSRSRARRNAGDEKKKKLTFLEKQEAHRQTIRSAAAKLKTAQKQLQRFKDWALWEKAYETATKLERKQIPDPRPPNLLAAWAEIASVKKEQGHIGGQDQEAILRKHGAEEANYMWGRILMAQSELKDRKAQRDSFPAGETGAVLKSLVAGCKAAEKALAKSQSAKAPVRPTPEKKAPAVPSSPSKQAAVMVGALVRAEERLREQGAGMADLQEALDAVSENLIGESKSALDQLLNLPPEVLDAVSRGFHGVTFEDKAVVPQLLKAATLSSMLGESPSAAATKEAEEARRAAREAEQSFRKKLEDRAEKLERLEFFKSYLDVGDEAGLQAYLVEEEAEKQAAKARADAKDKGKKPKEAGGAPLRRKKQEGYKGKRVSTYEAFGGRFTVLPDPPRFPENRSGKWYNNDLCGNPIDGSIYVIALPQQGRYVGHALTREDEQAVWEAASGVFTPANKRKWSRKQDFFSDMEAVKEYLGPYTQSKSLDRLTERGQEFIYEDNPKTRRTDEEGNPIKFYGGLLPFTHHQKELFEAGYPPDIRTLRIKKGKRSQKPPRLPLNLGQKPVGAQSISKETWFYRLPPDRTPDLPEYKDGAYVIFTASAKKAADAAKLTKDFQPPYKGKQRTSSPFFSWQRLYRPITETAAGYREPLCETDEQRRVGKMARAVRGVVGDTRYKLDRIGKLLDDASKWPEMRLDVLQRIGDEALRSLAWLGSWLQDINYTLQRVPEYAWDQYPEGDVLRAFATASADSGGKINLEGLVKVIRPAVGIARTPDLSVVNEERTAKLIGGLEGLNLLASAHKSLPNRLAAVPLSTSSPAGKRLVDEVQSLVRKNEEIRAKAATCWIKAESTKDAKEARKLVAEMKALQTQMPLLAKTLDQAKHRQGHALVNELNRLTKRSAEREKMKQGLRQGSEASREKVFLQMIMEKQQAAQLVRTLDMATLSETSAKLFLMRQPGESNNDYDTRLEQTFGRFGTVDPETKESTQLKRIQSLQALWFLYAVMGGAQMVDALTVVNNILGFVTISGGRRPPEGLADLFTRKQAGGREKEKSQERARKRASKLEAILRAQDDVLSKLRSDLTTISHRLQIRGKKAVEPLLRRKLEKEFQQKNTEAAAILAEQPAIREGIKKIREDLAQAERRHETGEIGALRDRVADIRHLLARDKERPLYDKEGIEIIGWRPAPAPLPGGKKERKALEQELKKLLRTIKQEEKKATLGRGLRGVNERIRGLVQGQQLSQAGNLTLYYTFNPILFAITKAWWGVSGGPWRGAKEEVSERMADVDAVGRLGVSLKLVYESGLSDNPKASSDLNTLRETLSETLHAHEVVGLFDHTWRKLMEDHGLSQEEAAMKAKEMVEEKHLEVEKKYAPLSLLRPFGSPPFDSITEARDLGMAPSRHLSKLRQAAEKRAFKYHNEDTKVQGGSLGPKARFSANWADDLESIGVGLRTKDALARGGVNGINDLVRFDPGKDFSRLHQLAGGNAVQAQLLVTAWKKAQEVGTYIPEGDIDLLTKEGVLPAAVKALKAAGVMSTTELRGLSTTQLTKIAKASKGVRLASLVKAQRLTEPRVGSRIDSSRKKQVGPSMRRLELNVVSDAYDQQKVAKDKKTGQRPTQYLRGSTLAALEHLEPDFDALKKQLHLRKTQLAAARTPGLKTDED